MARPKKPLFTRFSFGRANLSPHLLACKSAKNHFTPWPRIRFRGFQVRYISFGERKEIRGAGMSLSDYIGKYWAGAEIVYGVILAMTFTSVLRTYPVVSEDVLTNVIRAAILCCGAWGVADGLFYCWERGHIIIRENTIIEYSRSPEKTGPAVALIGEQLDNTILRNISPENRTALYQKLAGYLSTAGRTQKPSSREAVAIIGGTFLRSVIAGLVVVSPFFLIDDLGQALAVSNLLGILLLFGVGYFRAVEEDVGSRLLMGLGDAMIGIIIAGITILLGG
jgi:hypothetical protein